MSAPFVIDLGVEREKRRRAEKPVTLNVSRSATPGLVVFQLTCRDLGMKLTWTITTEEAETIGRMFGQAAVKP